MKSLAALLSLLSFGSPLLIVSIGVSVPGVLVSFPRKVSARDNAYYQQQGLNSYAQGDYRAAIADFTKAIQIDPSDSDAYVQRGVSKWSLAFSLGGDQGPGTLKNKLLSSAASDYTQAIAINPNNAFAYMNRGSVKDELEDYIGAIEDHSKALEINPNNGKIYLLGEVVLQ